jgi:hypothetical protein
VSPSGPRSGARIHGRELRRRGRVEAVRAPQLAHCVRAWATASVGAGALVGGIVPEARAAAIRSMRRLPGSPATSWS